MGKMVTVVGILLSIACAYFARQYNNAMDVIQLVFGFVNAPLFATFIFGMFWVRTTATGAFWGLLLGTATSATFHALTLASGNCRASRVVISMLSNISPVKWRKISGWRHLPLSLVLC